MKKEELDYFRGLLLDEKQKLLEALGYLKTNSMDETSKDQAGDSSSCSTHMAEHGTDAAEREKAFASASREGKYLYHLNEALKRIEDGSYGICRTCDENIPKNRLEAVPVTTQCMKCKNKEKKRR